MILHVLVDLVLDLKMSQREGVPHLHHDRLEEAIAAALDGTRDRDLVLLLGAQAMDAGADIARRLLTPE